MRGIDTSKSSESDRFKQETHDKALEKLGYPALFGSSLASGFGSSLSAASFGAALISDRSPRDTVLPPVGLGLLGGDRVDRSSLVGNHLSGGSLGISTGGGGGGSGGKDSSGGELVKFSLVYDIASLILYKFQALRIRLKIALDRLFAALSHEDVLQILHGLGWTYEDYTRGYMLQDRSGAVLHKWNMVTPEEEVLLLQQFLRFGETKALVQQLMQQEPEACRLDQLARDVREATARDLKESRDHHRDYRDHHHRDHGEHREHRDHRDHRDHREYRNHRDLRDYRESRSDHHHSRRDDISRHSHHVHQPHSQSHNQHHSLSHQPQLPDPTKLLEQDQIKSLLERNFLFHPFMRGATDPTSLLRSPHPAHPSTLNPTPNLTAASLASNLLAVNPSLASSLLANPQLANSLSMLRMPIPPVSLPNISPSNGTLNPPFGSPTSPIGSSPLNRLQSMQPFDFRKERKSPSPAPRTHISDMNLSLSHSARPASATTTSPGSVTSTGSFTSGSSPVSTITPSTSISQPVNSQPNPLHGGIEYIENLSDDEETSSGVSVALNLSTATTTTSPVTTPAASTATSAGCGPGGLMPMPSKSVSPSGGPTSPPKRSWNPINLGTSLINPVTGKKRVQCNVCLKTFCDKGALKIHFSAVHLREMHKCTVEGCNMMFSSRRSRNRHSANPNPKLHTPHVRRKISPHDGRTSAAHSVMLPHSFPSSIPNSLQPPTGFPPLGAFPSQFGAINPLTGLPFIPHSAAANTDLHKQAMEFQRQSLEMQAMGKNSLDLSMRDRDDMGWRYGNNSSLSEDGQNSDTSARHSDSNDAKRQRKSNSDGTIAEEEGEDDNMSVDAHSTKGECIPASPSLNKRKRKNQNPTKFAFRLEDDDLISTDDDDDDDNDDDLDDVDGRDSEEEKNEDKELDAMSDVEDEDTKVDVKSSLSSNIIPTSSSANVVASADKDIIKTEKEEESKNKVTSSNFDEPTETSNALRHLEDLSKGNFSHMQNSIPQNGTIAFGSSLIPSANIVTSSSPKPSDRESDRDSNPDTSYDDAEEGQEYNECGFLANIDIPLDKENPRRCIACGKMFQNHFGVKTHYQNVHLKLMHTCTVDGCNAAFPSKRSRDRHASNLNLHRKLLSTSDGSIPGSFPGIGFPGLPFNPALNPELIARLYSDPTALSLNLDALKSQLPTSFTDNLFNGDRLSNSNSTTNINNNIRNTTAGITSTSSPSPFFLHNLLPHLTANNNLPKPDRMKEVSQSKPLSPTSLCSQIISSEGSQIIDSNNSIPTTTSASFGIAVNNDSEMMEDDCSWNYSLELDLPTPDRDGNMPCRFCSRIFEDGDRLKKHYEDNHKKDMHKCTVHGCNKVFSSRRKRNNHALNGHPDLGNPITT